MLRALAVITLAAAFALPTAASAQGGSDSAPTSLSELYESIRKGAEREAQENQQREAEFRAKQAQQHGLLEEALTAEAIAQARAEELERQFEANENTLPELEATLQNRLGSLGELFGVVRQVAGDMRSRVETSIISAQLPGREKFLSELAQSRELPKLEDLERLWLALQREMTEQGRVVSFPATVIKTTGEETKRQVIRIGPFNAISGGKYLTYLSERGQLAELARQPASRHLNTVASFERARAGLAPVSIDPTRGTILSMLIEAPDLRERVQQGGVVGYVIIILGILGFVIAIYRLVSLAIAGRKIRAQLAKDKADSGNALGRIFSVYESNRSTNVETLELRLDEAILKETSKLQRGATFVKVLSVIAPLLGLLGTVTGMILTFQQITLFGTGDPKVMAGGISQALVTTVLGLTMAIPLTLLHSMISDRGRTLSQILEENGVGMVAEQAEALARKVA